MADLPKSAKYYSDLPEEENVYDADHVFVLDNGNGARVTTEKFVDTVADKAGVHDMVSDEFDEEKEYSMGDYCIYNNTLYKFTTNKESGEWDDSAVKSTTAAKEIYSASIIIPSRMKKGGRNLLESDSIESLYEQVHDNYLNDIYVDDYIPVDITTSLGGSEHVQLDVADMNYFYNCGSSDVKIMTDHHLVLVPHDQFATAASMNSSNTTEGGYTSCALRTNVLPVYYNALNEQLNGHILTHSRYLTTVVNTSASSAGGANLSGSATTAAWTECTLELMSEAMVYGGSVFSSSGRDISDACMQLAKFALCPEERVCNAGYNSNERRYWWLCGVASSAYFCYCTLGGNAGNSGAGGAYGVRPYLLFG